MDAELSAQMLPHKLSLNISRIIIILTKTQIVEYCDRHISNKEMRGVAFTLSLE